MKPEDAKAVSALQANWRAERETALVYRDLAANEADEKRRGILLRMAEAEERHAVRWEARLQELGAEPPVLTNDLAAAPQALVESRCRRGCRDSPNGSSRGSRQGTLPGAARG